MEGKTRQTASHLQWGSRVLQCLVKPGRQIYKTKMTLKKYVKPTQCVIVICGTNVGVRCGRSGDIVFRVTFKRSGRNRIIVTLKLLRGRIVVTSWLFDWLAYGIIMLDSLLSTSYNFKLHFTAANVSHANCALECGSHSLLLGCSLAWGTHLRSFGSCCSCQWISLIFQWILLIETLLTFKDIERKSLMIEK